ncbi:S8 family serine peptidase [Iodobacter arcticus]|uniref:S8 family serine peptidase n=1 Tax=Iodobacter arcticus TaxID=590593 RepID=A0ABW2QZ73_9NEIS
MKQKTLATAVSLALSLLVLDAYSATPVQDRYYPLTPGDPLLSQQWFLQNTGQNAFSKSGGVPGMDLNLDFTTQRGIRGVGVTIAVIDDGLEIKHPDLAANIKRGSKNFVTGSDDPSPDSPHNAHGTAVAGIAAAVGFNGIGGRGVAPKAGLKGYNWLLNQSFEGFLHSHGKLPGDPPLQAHTDSRVFNQSYGSPSLASNNGDVVSNLQLQLEEQVYEEVTRHSHWGRGAWFVKSAGNDYQAVSVSLDDGSPAYLLPFVRGNDGLPMQDAGLDPTNSNYWNIVVSAMNASGVRSSYSTVGASVLLTAPGGEYGTDSPAMVTTDLTSCESGWNIKGDSSTTLHGGNAIDPNCNYTSRMNGTSSAAPATSGALALVASANPALNWRDIRHILIKTARKVDASQPGVQLSFNGKDGAAQKYLAIPGWQKNAAGYSFHNFYGFGLIDVDRAVEAALSYARPLPALEISDWKQIDANVSIPDASVKGAESSYQQYENSTVEAVQVRLNIDHERAKDLSVELISPSGTRSVILSARTGLVLESKGFTEQRLLSHHFYGEKAKGQWKLRVIDTNGANAPYNVLIPNPRSVETVDQVNNSQDGFLKSWSIRFIGHK